GLSSPGTRACSSAASSVTAPVATISGSGRVSLAGTGVRMLLALTTRGRRLRPVSRAAFPLRAVSLSRAFRVDRPLPPRASIFVVSGGLCGEQTLHAYTNLVREIFRV